MSKPQQDAPETPPRERALPVARIGIAGGLVGMVCCVGPTLLALLGVVSAGTAFVWATDLYDNYRWWFRLAGLAVTASLIWLALRRRNQCSLAGARMVRWRLVAIAVSAVVTYVVLYSVTTWLGSLAP